MRKNIKYTALTVLAAFCLSAFGCNEVVVTNVNEYLTVPEGSVELTEMAQSSNANDVVAENENANNENTNNEKVETSDDFGSDKEETVETGSEGALTEETEDENGNGDAQTETDDENDDADSENEDVNDDENDTEDENDEQGVTEEPEELIIPDTFDVEFYARTYPDVVEVFGDSPEALYKHYLDYGLAEGRMASENAGVIPESEDNIN